MAETQSGGPLTKDSAFLNLALVADDEDVFCKLLAKALAAEGLQVHTAADGMAAIELIEKNRYAVILTDLMMPRAGGLEVLRAAKRTDPDAAVILVTGYASLDSALAAIKEGAYDYITKPFQLEEIRLTVANAIEKRRLLEQNRVLMENLEAAYHQIEELVAKTAGGGSQDVNRELSERQRRIYERIQSLRMMQGLPERGTDTNQKKTEMNGIEKRTTEPAPPTRYGMTGTGRLR